MQMSIAMMAAIALIAAKSVDHKTSHESKIMATFERL